RQRVRRGIEVVDDLAADHDVRHQREQRDRDQQVAVQLAEDDFADGAQVALGEQQQTAAKEGQAGEDRQTGEQQRDDAGQYQQEGHSATSSRCWAVSSTAGIPTITRASATRAASAISTPPTGSINWSRYTGTSTCPVVRMPSILENIAVFQPSQARKPTATSTASMPQAAAICFARPDRRAVKTSTP